MDIEKIKDLGFKQSSFMHDLYSYNSDDMLKRLFHILLVDGDFIFRGMGRTIAKIENEKHLIELKKEYDL